MILAEHDRDRVVFLATRPRLTLADDMRLEVNVNLVGNQRAIFSLVEKL